MLACTLYEHALLLRHTPGGTDTASAALAAAKAIATSCGMTRLLTVLDRQHEHAPGSLTLAREDRSGASQSSTPPARQPRISSGLIR